MATIAEQLTELQAVKSGLKTALINDGTDMSAVSFPEYPGKVQAMSDRFRSIIDGSITEVVIPNGTTKIKVYAFYGCFNIKGDIKIPDSVKNIGVYAFSQCASITGITISEGVTIIGAYAFDGCSSITSITIPASVTIIGKKTLNIGSASAKATIIMRPTTPPQIESNTIGPYVSRIVVPVGTGDTYKSAPVWSDYASIIEEGTA